MGEKSSVATMVVKDVLTITNYDDNDDEYLSADEGSVVGAEDLSAAIFDDDDEEYSAGIYFSLPDINIDLNFNYQLTEPFFPPMSDHDFLRYYSLNPPLVSGLVLLPKHVTENPQIEYVSLSHHHPQSTKTPDFAFLEAQNLKIIHTCNGLFLCFSPTFKAYYISNLTVEQTDLLPGSAVIQYPSALSLAYDPYTSPNYKVISVQKVDQGNQSLDQLSIYSSETRLWTVSGKPFDAPGDMDFSQGVFCNGAIHWMKRTTQGIYFDVDAELLKDMPKPPLEEHSLLSCEYFGESNDRLFYAVSSPEVLYLELFEMKEDYTGWFVKTRIDLQALSVKFPLIARRSEKHPVFGLYEGDIISVVQGQDDEDVEVIISIPGQVIAYNSEKKTAKKLCDSRLRPDDKSVWYRIYSSYQVI